MAEGPRLTFFGKLIVFLVLVGCGYLAYRYLAGGQSWPWQRARTEAPASSGGGAPGGAAAIGVAYGTEKKPWLEWAVHEFANTKDGKDVRIELIPMGSLEAAQALLAGDHRIHVWSPASALYKQIFLQEWSVKQSGMPIVREENLALTPMVFVMWDERYQAFVRKYGKVTFETIRQALQEKSGWQTIANRPDWGIFKFGHTHPGQSNSGIMTLVAMAYEYHKKSRALELQDILDPGFQTWMGEIESGVTGLSNSTGNMMREMVLKGPSSFDVLFVYENVAIDHLKNAEGRWGQLRTIYPERNIWNENPYYILDTPWSTKEQREASAKFLDFLLSETVQQQALVHGFRPGNPAVPVRTATSPFTTQAAAGLQIDVGTICEPPRAEVVSNLLSSWQRQYGVR